MFTSLILRTHTYDINDLWLESWLVLEHYSIVGIISWKNYVSVLLTYYWVVNVQHYIICFNIHTDTYFQFVCYLSYLCFFVVTNPILKWKIHTIWCWFTNIPHVNGLGRHSRYYYSFYQTFPADDDHFPFNFYNLRVIVKYILSIKGILFT